jgi:hypothetical protein
MRAKEFMREDASSGATVSGGFAVVEQPLGMISRAFKPNPAKYSNSAPSAKNKRKKYAHG